MTTKRCVRGGGIVGALLVAAAMSPHARGDNWPGFRGVDGRSVSTESSLPEMWGPNQNVRWRVDLPGRSNGSPVVWGDRVFVAQGVDKDHRRTVMCFDRADVIRHGEEYIDELEGCGVDMLLAGHLHLAYHDDLRSHYKSAKRSILSVQAGTATSTRRRGEPNAYNWITVSPDLCTVAVRAWCNGRFEESLVTRYHRIDGVWQTEKQVPVDEVGAKVVGAAVPQTPQTTAPPPR